MNRESVEVMAVVVSLVISEIGLLSGGRAELPHAQGRKMYAGVAGDDPCVPGSCTIFAVRRGEKVFFGNNEDWSDPKTIYWVEPSAKGQYGSVYLGFNHYNPQGGINEKGLAFDYNALPREIAKASKPTPLRDLFSRQTVEQAQREHRAYGAKNR